MTWRTGISAVCAMRAATAASKSVLRMLLVQFSPTGDMPRPRVAFHRYRIRTSNFGGSFGNSTASFAVSILVHGRPLIVTLAIRRDGVRTTSHADAGGLRFGSSTAASIVPGSRPARILYGTGPHHVIPPVTRLPSPAS